jgi:serine/threonine protein phosphatase PrpC
LTPIDSSVVDVRQLNKYKHVVTRSVQGEIDRSKIDYFKISDFSNQNSLFICSDGVIDVMSGIQIEYVFDSTSSHSEAMKIIEDRLIKEANDNFSMMLVNFKQKKFSKLLLCS